MTSVGHRSAVFSTYERCKGAKPVALAAAARPAVETGAPPALPLRSE